MIPGRQPCFAQALDQPQHQRRLAAATDGQVADTITGTGRA
jgi:hypothetical protein